LRNIESRKSVEPDLRIKPGNDDPPLGQLGGKCRSPHDHPLFLLEPFGVADNNGYGLKVFAFSR
jgi:hypothetical protein